MKKLHFNVKCPDHCGESGLDCAGLAGTPDLLQVAAAFLPSRLAAANPVLPANLRAVNGVSAGLEAVGWALADPGQVILVPTPTYARRVTV